MKNLLRFLLFSCCGVPFFAPGQPLRTTLLPTPGNIQVTNDSLSRNYANITLQWQLTVNGLTRQKGVVPGLSLLPRRSRTVHLPLHPPATGEEAFIKVEYHGLPRSGPPLATQWLPWKAWGGDTQIPVAGELNFADSDNVFTISSPTLRLSFDKETGWIRHYEANHHLLLADTNALRPILPASPHLQLFSTSTGSQLVIVRTEYTLPELSCLLHLSYTINAAGAMLIEQTLETDTTRPDSLVHTVDRFGINWALPPGCDSITWYGLTTEDPAGSRPSIHGARLTAEPGQTGVAGSPATQVRWWGIQDHEGKGWQVSADSNSLHQVTTAGGIVHIAEGPSPHPSLAIHYHLIFKVTPVK